MADNWVQLSRAIAGEVLRKILYFTDQNHFFHEMGECHEQFDPVKAAQIIGTSVWNQPLHVHAMNTDTFSVRYDHFQIEARQPDGSPLQKPNAFATLTGFSAPTQPQPSATTQLKADLETRKRRFERSPDLSLTDAMDVLSQHAIGRRQLSGSIKNYFENTIRSRTIGELASTAAIEVISRFVSAIDDAQAALAVVGREVIENIDGRRVDSIVLADFSTCVAAILTELAKSDLVNTAVVRIYIVTADLHFISTQDTEKWIRFFKRTNVAKFYKLQGQVPFGERDVSNLFDDLKRRSSHSVLMTGAERVIPDGSVLNFPGIPSLASIALKRAFDVVVATETYKIQHLVERDELEIGRDAAGAAVPLPKVGFVDRVLLVTDHGVHTQFNAHSSGEVRRRGAQLALCCCSRHWMNRLEGKNYPLGLIFDLAGTLLDSEPVHLKLYSEFGKELGFSLTKEEYARSLKGRTDRDTILHMATVAGKIEAAERVIREKQQAYLECLRSGNVPAIPGAVEFVRKVSTQSFKIGVATSATHEEAVSSLTSLGLVDLIHVLVTEESVSRGKPAPDIYQMMAKLLKLAPRECVVYEDAPAGVEAALTAGMATVTVGPDAGEFKRSPRNLMRIPNYINHDIPEL